MLKSSGANLMRWTAPERHCEPDCKLDLTHNGCKQLFRIVVSAISRSQRWSCLLTPVISLCLAGFQWLIGLVRQGQCSKPLHNSPLVEFYAARGFAVIQPTHQDSKALGVDPNGPEGPLFWRSRAQDMHFILDHLDEIEAGFPALDGCLDRHRIAAVGHSMGGHTVGMLAGMHVTDPVDNKIWDLSDGRVKAVVMLAPPGKGADLAAFASKHYPVLRNNSFAEMATPALVIAGDQDQSPRFADRQDWRADAYTFSPGPKNLLTMFGAKHSLGGVSGYDVRESQDDDPERLGVVQRLSWPYLRSELYPGDPAWRDGSDALAQRPEPQGKVVFR